MNPTILLADEVVVPDATASRWLGDLPVARRERLATRTDRRERDRSLLATRLLRAALVRRGFAPDALGQMTWSAEGRPSLPLPVHFSFSHCDGCSICALSVEGPVGIDVERLGPVTAAEVALYLGPEERVWAGSDPARFYALWTRKEAVVKAAGVKGLRDLQAVRVEGDQALFEGRTWHTAPVTAGDDFVAHLAAATPLQPLAAERMEATALM